MVTEDNMLLGVREYGGYSTIYALSRLKESEARLGKSVSEKFIKFTCDTLPFSTRFISKRSGRRKPIPDRAGAH
uniref:Uncharacterized protein n=1 Tax=Romanomermis culicivorax TaxID=13658 RepID=A0A915IHS9_ROMCU